MLIAARYQCLSVPAMLVCCGVQVLASYGHVRDLLNKPGAVDPAADFNLVWQVAGAAGAGNQDELD